MYGPPEEASEAKAAAGGEATKKMMIPGHQLKPM